MTSEEARRQARRRRKRRAFSPEFKQEAVRLLEARLTTGGTLIAVARELDVGRDQLRQWQHQFGQPRPKAPAARGASRATLEAELQQVQRELEVTRQERDFLKKAAAFFAKESQ
jgi:transposase